jgi:hypothetical protein
MDVSLSGEMMEKWRSTEVQLENVENILGPMTLGNLHRRTKGHERANEREICR